MHVRQVFARCRGIVLAAGPPPFENLSRFAGNLATCLEAGLGMTRSLKTAKRALANTRVSGAMDVALRQVEHGATLSESLAAAESRLPAFFVPMIQAGEQTGRLDQSLRYLEHHCEMLAAPARALRNAWLIPLVIALFGTAIKLAMHILLAPWRMTVAFLFDSLTSYATLGIIVLIAVSSPVRPLLDQLYLALPVIGSVERDIAANRFFQAFAMLYAAAGQRVENMIRVAASTVKNRTLQTDLLNVAEQVEQGASLPEAFESSRYVSREQRNEIESGDESGTLERSFERISNDAGERLKFRLQSFEQIFLRVMTFAVASSIVMTLIALYELL